MSPESATADPWRKILHKQNNIAMVAVDEAHCISEWWVTDLAYISTQLVVYIFTVEIGGRLSGDPSRPLEGYEL